MDFADGVTKALASLKLTVALFAFGIFVVLVGTLAQTDADIWQVVRDYFHAWIMWVDVNLFFPKSFFPRHAAPRRAADSAHARRHGRRRADDPQSARRTRLAVQDAGQRHAALGWPRWRSSSASPLTTLVILRRPQLRRLSSAAADRLAGHVVGPASGCSAAGLIGAAVVFRPIPACCRQHASASITWLRMLELGGAAVVLALVALAIGGTLLNGWYIGDEAMRVLWQLCKAALSGVVLSSAAFCSFKKRAASCCCTRACCC